jgi:hypothetical protein
MVLSMGLFGMYGSNEECCNAEGTLSGRQRLERFARYIRYVQDSGRCNAKSFGGAPVRNGYTGVPTKIRTAPTTICADECKNQNSVLSTGLHFSRGLYFQILADVFSRLVTYLHLHFI